MLSRIWGKILNKSQTDPTWQFSRNWGRVPSNGPRVFQLFTRGRGNKHKWPSKLAERRSSDAAPHPGGLITPPSGINFHANSGLNVAVKSASKTRPTGSIQLPPYDSRRDAPRRVYFSSTATIVTISTGIACTFLPFVTECVRYVCSPRMLFDTCIARKIVSGARNINMDNKFGID